MVRGFDVSILFGWLILQMWNVNELFIRLLSSEILVWLFVLVIKCFVVVVVFLFVKFGEEESVFPLTEPAPPPFLGTLLWGASLSPVARSPGRLWLRHGAAAAKGEHGARACCTVSAGQEWGKNLGCGNFVYQCEQPAFLLHLRMLSCQ